jgi:hypothetical protein
MRSPKKSVDYEDPSYRRRAPNVRKLVLELHLARSLSRRLTHLDMQVAEQDTDR